MSCIGTLFSQLVTANPGLTVAAASPASAGFSMRGIAALIAVVLYEGRLQGCMSSGEPRPSMVVTLFGRVYVIVNNAGVMPLSPLSALKVAEWDQMIDVNIRGVLNGEAAVLPIMEAQGHGQIVNIASTAGHQVVPTAAVYCATKFAVRALSEGLRQEGQGPRQHCLARRHHLGTGRNDQPRRNGGLQRRVPPQRHPGRSHRPRRPLRHRAAGGGGRQRDHRPADSGSGVKPPRRNRSRLDDPPACTCEREVPPAQGR